MNKLITLIIFIAFAWGCQSDYPGVPKTYHALLDSAFVQAGDNATEMQKALTEAPKEQKEGMAFIISYMPKRDLTSLSAEFLMENAEYAYKAREKYAWCAALPDLVFFNEVLPYANISEDRDAWRKNFYERFAKYTEGKENMVDALMEIAKNIKDEVNVEYNTKRSKVDISPLQAMKENMATCTGLSILLTDAYRAVGIPSRLAGTAMWTNYRGNHTWSEVLVDNEWQFIEYYPDTLNKSWFLADAGKADPKNMLHWIYAVSYKPTGMPFYAGGSGAMQLADKIDLNALPEQMRKRYERTREYSKNREKQEPYIWGVNVTDKYIALYQESIKNSKLADNELIANVVVFADANTSKSESRMSCRVDVSLDGKDVSFGYSPRKTDDMNQFLQFKLKKETAYKFVLTSPENNITKEFTITTGSDETFDVPLVLTN